MPLFLELGKSKWDLETHYEAESLRWYSLERPKHVCTPPSNQRRLRIPASSALMSPSSTVLASANNCLASSCITHTQTEITIKSHYRHFCWGISFFPPSALIATVDLAHCSLLSLTGEAQGWKMAALEHGHLPRLVLTARAASANSISSRSMALTMIIKDWVVLLYTTALNWWHSSSE